MNYGALVFRGFLVVFVGGGGFAMACYCWVRARDDARPSAAA